VNTLSHFEPKATNADAFAAWASVYDQQRNPLLALEDRILKCILPDFKGKTAVDIGCGTGRWLSHLAQGGVTSLYGLDNSPAMLEVAGRRCSTTTQLIQAELPLIPLDSNSTDLALASFVFSYVADLESCVLEMARVVRAGGDLFISDMHPETAAALGWTRGFSSAGQTYQLAVQNHSIGAVINTAVSKGFRLATCLEPQFGDSEYDLFRLDGRELAWKQSIGMPPIYLLHFRRLPEAPEITRKESSVPLVVHGARCAVGPHELIAASVDLHGGPIASMLSDAVPAHDYVANDACDLDLSGYLLLPGLINAHDHLEFALFPRLGSPLYRNATEWALDIQVTEAETIRVHKRVPREVRLWWGGLRNLLSGVTTVCHHNPWDAVLQSEDFPVRVLREYGWEHSLAFASDIPAAMLRTGPEVPFVIHAGEGVDLTAAEELLVLDGMGALNDRSVLVHGLALEETAITLLNERGSALVVCPSSNEFLFQLNHTPQQLLAIDRLALGSDSPLTADGNLLDELRFTRDKALVTPERLYRMVTTHASRILRLRRGEGSLRVGAAGDLVALRHRDGDPAEILSGLSWRDVDLVIVGGIVRLASPAVFNRLPAQTRRELSPLQIEDEIRWLRGPVLELLRSAENVLGTGNVRLGGLRVSITEGTNDAR
jgi:cytosine/adenosine deaminase-related metal-dependent hydrolase/ubiquinone/menaquinone biosynthesis C-methylase UbiE